MRDVSIRARDSKHTHQPETRIKPNISTLTLSQLLRSAPVRLSPQCLIPSQGHLHNVERTNILCLASVCAGMAKLNTSKKMKLQIVSHSLWRQVCAPHHQKDRQLPTIIRCLYSGCHLRSLPAFTLGAHGFPLVSYPYHQPPHNT